MVLVNRTYDHITQGVDFKMTIGSVNMARKSNDDEIPFSALQSAPSYVTPMTISQKFGQRVRELRVERGMTQIQLAIAAGADRSFISDVERGVKDMTTSKMYEIALVFHISLSELMKGVE